MTISTKRIIIVGGGIGGTMRPNKLGLSLASR